MEDLCSTQGIAQTCEYRNVTFNIRGAPPPSPLSGGRMGERADYGVCAERPQGQRVPIVLQHNDGPCCNVARHPPSVCQTRRRFRLGSTPIGIIKKTEPLFE